MTRRLPVIQGHGRPPAEPDRWKWVALGAGCIIAVWVPLALGAQRLSQRLAEGIAPVRDPAALMQWIGTAGARDRAMFALAVGGPALGSLLIAALAGGFTLGAAKARPTDAALAGGLAALGAAAFSSLRTGLVHGAPVVLIAATAGFAASWLGHQLASALRRLRTG